MSKPAYKQDREKGFVLDPASVLVGNALNGAVESLAAQREAFLASARAEAAEMVKTAHAQAEQVRQSAFDAGYSEGYEKGMNEWAQSLRDLAEERDGFLRQAEELNRSLEADILKLSVQIAEKIVRKTVEEHDDTALEVLRLALRQLKDRANVRIWVNKTDLERVRAARDDIASWVESLRNVEIAEDRRVDRGGVIIESNDGVLDARPSSQLKEIERRLLEAQEQQ